MNSLNILNGALDATAAANMDAQVLSEIGLDIASAQAALASVGNMSGITNLGDLQTVLTNLDSLSGVLAGDVVTAINNEVTGELGLDVTTANTALQNVGNVAGLSTLTDVQTTLGNLNTLNGVLNSNVVTAINGQVQTELGLDVSVANSALTNIGNVSGLTTLADVQTTLGNLNTLNGILNSNVVTAINGQVQTELGLDVTAANTAISNVGIVSGLTTLTDVQSTISNLNTLNGVLDSAVATAINGQVQTELGLDVSTANTALQNVGNVAGLTTLADVQTTLGNLNTLNGVLDSVVANAINGQVQTELGVNVSQANTALQNVGNVAGLTNLTDVQSTISNLNTLNGILNSNVVTAINGQVQTELGLDVSAVNTALQNVGNVSGLTTLTDVQSTISNLNTLNGILNSNVVTAINGQVQTELGLDVSAVNTSLQNIGNVAGLTTLADVQSTISNLNTLNGILNSNVVTAINGQVQTELGIDTAASNTALSALGNLTNLATLSEIQTVISSLNTLNGVLNIDVVNAINAQVQSELGIDVAAAQSALSNVGSLTGLSDIGSVQTALNDLVSLQGTLSGSAATALNNQVLGELGLDITTAQAALSSVGNLSTLSTLGEIQNVLNSLNILNGALDATAAANMDAQVLSEIGLDIASAQAALASVGNMSGITNLGDLQTVLTNLDSLSGVLAGDVVTAINNEVTGELGLDVTTANTALQNVGNVAGLSTLTDVQTTLGNLNTLNGVLNSNVVTAINGQVQTELGLDVSVANSALTNIGNVSGLTTLADVQTTLGNLNTLNGILNSNVVTAINGQVQTELGLDVTAANTAISNVGIVSGLTTLTDVQSTISNLNTLNGVLDSAVATAINGQVQTELGLDVSTANTALQNVGNVAGLTTLADVQTTLGNLNTLNGVLDSVVANAINGQVQTELGVNVSQANTALQNVGNVAGLTNLTDVQSTISNLNTLNGILNSNVVTAINGQVQTELGLDVSAVNTALQNVGNVSGLTTLTDVQSTISNLNTLNGILNSNVVTAINGQVQTELGLDVSAVNIALTNVGNMSALNSIADVNAALSNLNTLNNNLSGAVSSEINGLIQGEIGFDVVAAQTALSNVGNMSALNSIADVNAALSNLNTLNNNLSGVVSTEINGLIQSEIGFDVVAAQTALSNVGNMSALNSIADVNAALSNLNTLNNNLSGAVSTEINGLIQSEIGFDVVASQTALSNVGNMSSLGSLASVNSVLSNLNTLNNNLSGAVSSEINGLIQGEIGFDVVAAQTALSNVGNMSSLGSLASVNSVLSNLNTLNNNLSGAVSTEINGLIQGEIGFDVVAAQTALSNVGNMSSLGSLASVNSVLSNLNTLNNNLSGAVSSEINGLIQGEIGFDVVGAQAALSNVGNMSAITTLGDVNTALANLTTLNNNLNASVATEISSQLQTELGLGMAAAQTALGNLGNIGSIASLSSIRTNVSNLNILAQNLSALVVTTMNTQVQAELGINIATVNTTLNNLADVVSVQSFNEISNMVNNLNTMLNGLATVSQNELLNEVSTSLNGVELSVAVQAISDLGNVNNINDINQIADMVSVLNQMSPALSVNAQTDLNNQISSVLNGVNLADAQTALSDLSNISNIGDVSQITTMISTLNQLSGGLNAAASSALNSQVEAATGLSLVDAQTALLTLGNVNNVTDLNSLQTIINDIVTLQGSLNSTVASEIGTQIQTELGLELAQVQSALSHIGSIRNISNLTDVETAVSHLESLLSVLNANAAAQINGQVQTELGLNLTQVNEALGSLLNIGSIENINDVQTIINNLSQLSSVLDANAASAIDAQIQLELGLSLADAQSALDNMGSISSLNDLSDVVSTLNNLAILNGSLSGIAGGSIASEVQSELGLDLATARTTVNSLNNLGSISTLNEIQNILDNLTALNSVLSGNAVNTINSQVQTEIGVDVAGAQYVLANVGSIGSVVNIADVQGIVNDLATMTNALHGNVSSTLNTSVVNELGLDIQNTQQALNNLGNIQAIDNIDTVRNVVNSLAQLTTVLNVNVVGAINSQMQAEFNINVAQTQNALMNLSNLQNITNLNDISTVVNHLAVLNAVVHSNVSNEFESQIQSQLGLNLADAQSALTDISAVTTMTSFSDIIANLTTLNTLYGNIHTDLQAAINAQLGLGGSVTDILNALNTLSDIKNPTATLSDLQNNIQVLAPVFNNLTSQMQTAVNNELGASFTDLQNAVDATQAAGLANNFNELQPSIDVIASVFSTFNAQIQSVIASELGVNPVDGVQKMKSALDFTANAFNASTTDQMRNAMNGLINNDVFNSSGLAQPMILAYLGVADMGVFNTIINAMDIIDSVTSSSSSTTDIQGVLDQLNDIKNNLYSDLGPVAQSLVENLLEGLDALIQYVEDIKSIQDSIDNAINNNDLAALQTLQAALTGSNLGQNYSAAGNIAQNLLENISEITSLSDLQSMIQIVENLVDLKVLIGDGTTTNNAEEINNKLDQLKAVYNASSQTVQNIVNSSFGINNFQNLEDMQVCADLLQQLTTAITLDNFNLVQQLLGQLQTAMQTVPNVDQSFLNSLNTGVAQGNNYVQQVEQERLAQQSLGAETYGIDMYSPEFRSTNNEVGSAELEAAIGGLIQTAITEEMAAGIIESVYASENISMLSMEDLVAQLQQDYNMNQDMVNNLMNALKALQEVIVKQAQQEALTMQDARAMLRQVLKATKISSANQQRTQKILDIVTAMTIRQLLNQASQPGNEALRDVVVDLMVAAMMGDVNFNDILLGKRSGKEMDLSTDVDGLLRLSAQITELNRQLMDRLADSMVDASAIRFSSTDGVITLALRESLSSLLTVSQMESVMSLINEYQSNINDLAASLGMNQYKVIATLNNQSLDLALAKKNQSRYNNILAGIKSDNVDTVLDSVEALENIIASLLDEAELNPQEADKYIQLAIDLSQKLQQAKAVAQSKVDKLENEYDNIQSEIEDVEAAMERYEEELAEVKGSTSQKEALRANLRNAITIEAEKLAKLQQRLVAVRTQLNQLSNINDILDVRLKRNNAAMAEYTILNEAYNEQANNEIDEQLGQLDDMIRGKVTADKVDMSAADIEMFDMFNSRILNQLLARINALNELLNGIEPGTDKYNRAVAIRNALDAQFLNVQQQLLNQALEMASALENAAKNLDTSDVSHIQDVARLNNMYTLLNNILKNSLSLTGAQKTQIQNALEQIGSQLTALMQNGFDSYNEIIANLKARLRNFANIDPDTAKTKEEMDAALEALYNGLFGENGNTNANKMFEVLADVIKAKLEADPNFARKFSFMNSVDQANEINKIINELKMNPTSRALIESLNELIGSTQSDQMFSNAISNILEGISNVKPSKVVDSVTANTVKIHLSESIKQGVAQAAANWMQIIKTYNAMLSDLGNEFVFSEDTQKLVDNIGSVLKNEDVKGDTSLSKLLSGLNALQSLQQITADLDVRGAESADLIGLFNNIMSTVANAMPVGTQKAVVDMDMPANVEVAKQALDEYKKSIGADNFEKRLLKDIVIVKDTTGKGGFMFEAKTNNKETIAAAKALNKVLAAFEVARFGADGFKLKQDQLEKVFAFLANPLKGHEILTGGGKTSVLIHFAALTGQLHGRDRGVVILSDKNKLDEALDSATEEMYKSLNMKVAVLTDSNNITEEKLKELEEADMIFTTMSVPGFLTRLQERESNAKKAFEYLTQNVQIVNDEIHTVVGQSFILSEGEARKLDSDQQKGIIDLQKVMANSSNQQRLIALNYAALVAQKIAQNDSLKRGLEEEVGRQMTESEVIDFILQEILGSDIAALEAVANQDATYIINKLQQYLTEGRGLNVATLDSALYKRIQGFGEKSGDTMSDMMEAAEFTDSMIKRFDKQETGKTDIAYVEGLRLLTIGSRMKDGKVSSIKHVFNDFVNAMFVQSLFGEVNEANMEKFKDVKSADYKTQRAALKSFATFVNQADGGWGTLCFKR